MCEKHATTQVPSNVSTEIAELQDKYQRALAELENQRKRTKREVEDAARHGREEVVQNLVPVLDNLERALKHAPAGPLTTGVRLVERELVETLNGFTLIRFSAKGAAFDPALHHAIEQRETTEVPPGTVAEEFAAGYLHGGRLLRPAMVAVAKAPAETPTEDPEPEAA